MQHDEEGRVVDVGARTRTIPPAVRPALHHRDRGCRFPGAECVSARGITSATGRTEVQRRSRTWPCCRRHHRAVHEDGYHLDRQPDGALRFRRPDGRVIPEIPLPPPAIPADPVERSGHGTPRRGSVSTRGRHARAGSVSAWTSCGRSTSCIRSPRGARRWAPAIASEPLRRRGSWPIPLTVLRRAWQDCRGAPNRPDAWEAEWLDRARPTSSEREATHRAVRSQGPAAEEQSAGRARHRGHRPGRAEAVGTRTTRTSTRR